MAVPGGHESASAYLKVSAPSVTSCVSTPRVPSYVHRTRTSAPLMRTTRSPSSHTPPCTHHDVHVSKSGGSGGGGVGSGDDTQLVTDGAETFK